MVNENAAQTPTLPCPQPKSCMFVCTIIVMLWGTGTYGLMLPQYISAFLLVMLVLNIHKQKIT